jgi:hypothetical protein
LTWPSTGKDLESLVNTYAPSKAQEVGNIEAMSTKPLLVSGWEITGIDSAEKFFSALSEILLPPVNLCFEGISIASDVQALFASNMVASSLEIPPGTIWPKPSVFHVRATEQFLQQLAVLAGKRAESEVCDHFHAFYDNQGLMQWYDAFSGDPLLVDEAIPETNVLSFCRKLGAQYARWSAPKYVAQDARDPHGAN